MLIISPVILFLASLIPQSSDGFLIDQIQTETHEQLARVEISVDGDIVFVTTKQSVRAKNLNTNEILWELSTDSTFPVVINKPNGRILVQSARDEIAELNAKTGKSLNTLKLKKKVNLGAGNLRNPPIATDNSVFCSNRSLGKIYRINLESGSVKEFFSYKTAVLANPQVLSKTRVPRVQLLEANEDFVLVVAAKKLLAISIDNGAVTELSGGRKFTGLFFKRALGLSLVTQMIAENGDLVSIDLTADTPTFKVVATGLKFKRSFGVPLLNLNALLSIEATGKHRPSKLAIEKFDGSGTSEIEFAHGPATGVLVYDDSRAILYSQTGFTIYDFAVTP